jgi:hypothetical protein
VHGVAAEVPEEVGVLLQDLYVDTRTSEEQTENHAGGAAAGHDTGGTLAGVRHPVRVQR